MSNTPDQTSARTLANRQNAQKSTGPKTEEGKARSSMNAVRGALTGRVVLLVEDDVDVYEKHLLAYFRQFRPLTDYEVSLVQALADTDWRLQRIPHLILALYTKGSEEFAETFDHLPEAERIVRIELETSLKYEKQLRNLHLQESRLHRRHEKDVAELRTVQRERDIRRAEQLAIAAKLHVAAQHDGDTFDPAEHGFEFTTFDVECYLKGQRASQVDLELRFAASRNRKQVDPTLAA